uniref:Uncharacterized protein n=1 Tax=Arion vulgaris TaxID=1028688 RepID=A0A0B6YQN6_9EUPU
MHFLVHSLDPNTGHFPSNKKACWVNIAEEMVVNVCNVLIMTELMTIHQTD